MAPASEVHIAGVGFSSSSSKDSSAKATIGSLISAATKALLDAGVTHDDVTQCVKSGRSKTSEYESEALKSFGGEGVAVDEVKAGSELDSAFNSVESKGAQCVLMAAVEDSTATAFVLVSDSFLLSRSYLKDSAVLIRKQNTSRSNSKGLHEICQMVWALRGWSQQRSTARQDKSLHYKGKSSQGYELSRSDKNPSPKWKDVEYRQDGKHRLRYNPANETRDISFEDFQAVCAEGTRHEKGGRQAQFKHQGGDRAALAKL